MYKNDGPWNKSVPANLIPAVEGLRKSFSVAHRKCGQITEIVGYASLHGELRDDYVKEFIEPLNQLQAIVETSQQARFINLLKEGTPPAIFKAFFQLYLDGMTGEARRIFRELVAIGRANQEHLASRHIEWALSQAKNLIRYHTHLIERWIKNVCDKQVHDRDREESIHWRKWRSPTLMIMKPCTPHLPYYPGLSWQRLDEKDTLSLLDGFKDHYVVSLEAELEKEAAKAEVELAKQPKTNQQSATRPDMQNRVSDLSGNSTFGKNRRSSKPSQAEVRKRGIIFGVLQCGLEGLDYCRELDKRRLPISADWKEGGCPDTYARAYRDDGWRKKIHDEKFRYSKKYRDSSKNESGRLIDQVPLTRHTRQ